MAEQNTPAPGIQATFAEAEALGAHVYVLAAPLHNGSLPGRCRFVATMLHACWTAGRTYRRYRHT